MHTGRIWRCVLLQVFGHSVVQHQLWPRGHQSQSNEFNTMYYTVLDVRRVQCERGLDDEGSVMRICDAAAMWKLKKGKDWIQDRAREGRSGVNCDLVRGGQLVKLNQEFCSVIGRRALWTRHEFHLRRRNDVHQQRRGIKDRI